MLRGTLMIAVATVAIEQPLPTFVYGCGLGISQIRNGIAVTTVYIPFSKRDTAYIILLLVLSLA